MKRILVVFTGPMELGGVERSLLGLLDSFDYTKYSVDLFLYSHHGVLFDEINKNVNVLSEVKELAYLRESISNKLKNKCFYSLFLRLVDEIRLKIFNKHINYDETWKKILNKKVSKLKQEYDIVLNFFLPFDLSILKVNSKIKVGWIHTDYSTEKNDLNHLFNQYSKMDYICAVSEDVRKTFIKMFPQLESKVLVVENILQENTIRKQSLKNSENVNFDKNVINLLSIGRFCHAKNFDNIPEICSLIKQSGLKIKWYIIGYGGDEQLIKNKIKQFKVENEVIILGKIDNPYPYIKACDIYVQPSRYEGKAVTVREAQILHKPVIITNYATAKSQIEDGIDGIIVPMDNVSCAKGIINFIKNKELQDKIRQNLKIRDYSNKQEVNKIYSLMEG